MKAIEPISGMLDSSTGAEIVYVPNGIDDINSSCRLRTRMTWVQGAEKDLEEKRLHCSSTF